MKTYLARPIVRTRFQPAAFMGQPFTYRSPVMRDREMLVNQPSANIERTEEGFKVQLAIPGVPKEHIQIKIMENQLIVTATNPNQEELRFVRREFDFSNFNRSFTLHKNADTDNMKANFENGILTVTIPNREPEVRKIEIQ